MIMRIQDLEMILEGFVLSSSMGVRMISWTQILLHT